MKRIHGVLGLFIVAMIWGTGFVATEIALTFYNPYQLMFLRFSLSFGVLLLVLNKRIFSFKVESIWFGFVLGVFLFLAFLFQTLGLQFTSVSNNAFITSLSVVFVPFTSMMIFKTKIPKKVIVGVAFCLLGIVFLTVKGSLTGFNNGDLLTLFCAIFFSLHIVFTDYFVLKTSPLELVVVQMGVASVLSLVSMMLFSSDIIKVETISFVPIIYLAFGSTLIAYMIQTLSQQHATSTETAVILGTEAFFGMVGSYFILGDEITAWMILGAILIFGGILITQLNFSKLRRI